MFKRNLTRYTMRFCAVLVCLNAFAKVPEPDTIFFGKVEHLNGRSSGGAEPLLPSADEIIQVQALLDGALIASATLATGTNSYVLRIPMDDGEAPRIEGAAQSGDVLHIRVINQDQNLAFEVTESKTSGIEIGEERGIVVQKELKVNENLKFPDADMDGQSDSYETQYSVPTVNGVAPLSMTQDDSAMDNDADGHSNLMEFIAGTNPLDKDSLFKVLDVEHTGSVYHLKCGPVKAGKYYMVQFKQSLAVPEWTTLVRIEAFSDSEYLSWNFDIKDVETGVFRAVVENK